MTFGVDLLALHSLRPLASVAASTLDHLVGGDDNSANGATGPSDFAQVLSRTADRAELTERIQGRIDTLLSAAGIPSSPPVEIAVDPRGRLEVHGDHPRAAEIEARLSGDRELMAQFDQLRQLSRVPVRLAWPPRG